VALLTDDVFMSMPPIPFEYEGRDLVARFCAGLFGAGRRFDLVPSRANGQPAFGAYLAASPTAPVAQAFSIFVLTLAGAQVSAITWFGGSASFARFGLPDELG
jgi:RNA polymerase sigma-70 factor (ECF subfamily)